MSSRKAGRRATSAPTGVTRAKAKRAVTPADAKHTFTPADAKHTVTPADAKHTVTPANAKRAVTPANAKYTVTPADAKRAVTPADAKHTVTPANAGVQGSRQRLDSGFRRNDGARVVRRNDGARVVRRNDGARVVRRNIGAKPIRADAVLTEIIRNGVLAVTEEMKTNLTRTAYNMIVYEALDFTVGLYTADGETVSIGMGLPMFIRGMAETIKTKLRHFGKDGLAPGDILVTNDSYTTGSHLNHVTFSLPIFYEGKLCAFACCMAHWMDIGGVLGGQTTDIYSEGLQIPVLKYQSAGVVNQDLVDIIRMNVRIPERGMGDLRAQVTAVKTGARRFIELLKRYGRAPVLAAIANIMDQSEAAARARTRTIPDGVYEAESYMDDDGVEVGKRIPIKVRVIKKGEDMTIDLSDVAKQVRGGFNSGATTGYACAQVAYKCLTSPTDYPINEGSFRALKVILTPGTVVTAIKPAAMRMWMTFPMTVVDTVLKAVERAIPGRTIAAHHADLVISSMSGISRTDGRLFLAGAGPLGGGWGAKLTEDGMSATVCLNDGDTHNSPCEQMESKYPILFERHALREDSCGAGRYRGGLGTEQVIRARAPLMVNVRIDRVNCRPWGLAGGLAGLGNEVGLCLDGKVSDPLPNGKVFNQNLKSGDAYTLRAAGGGGFGSPLAREPEKVAYDVRQGYVSRKAARELYRVALDANGEADMEATRKLRA